MMEQKVDSPGWWLVDAQGNRQCLSTSDLIFIGREDCNVIVESRSVDRRHAVLKYDGQEHTFKVKDLGSQNGTFINDCQVGEDDFTLVQGDDQLRFGFDPLTYRLVKDDLCVVAQPDSEQQAVHAGDIVSGDTGKVKPWRKNWTVQHGIAECAGCLSEQGVHHTCGMEQQQEHEQSPIPVHHFTHDAAAARNSASVTPRAAGVWPGHGGAYPYSGSVGPEASQGVHAYPNHALLYSSYAPEGVSYRMSAAEGQRFVAADDMFVGQRAGQYISNVYPDSRQQGTQHFALAQPVPYDVRDMASRYMPVVAQQQQQQVPLTVWGYQQQQAAGPTATPPQHAIHSHSHICVTHTLTPPIYDSLGYINPNPSTGLHSNAPPPQHDIFLRRNSQPCARCLVAVQQQPHYVPADVHRQYAPTFVEQRYTPPQFVSAFPAQASVVTTGSQPHLATGGGLPPSRLEPQTPTSAPPHTALTFTLAPGGTGEPTGHVPLVQNTVEGVNGEEIRDTTARSTPASAIAEETSFLTQAKSDEQLDTRLSSSVSAQQLSAAAIVPQQPQSATAVVLSSSAAASQQQSSPPVATSQHQQPQPRRRGKLGVEGTPLYGVPSWWGDDDIEEPPTNGPPSQKLAPSKEVSRPSSLEVSKQEKPSKLPQTPGKHTTEVFTLAAGSSREPAAPLTPPEKDTGFSLFDTDKEPIRQDNSGGVQKSRSAGATPSNEALNSQPGFAFTIDFGDGEQQSSKHKERLQQRLLQDKKRDRKDKSGDGMAPDDLLITPRKTPDDKSKQGIQKDKLVHRPPSVGSPLTERRAAAQHKKYSLDSESDLLHTSRGDKSRTSLSKTTASQAQRPAALVSSAKVNYSRSKSVGQKGDLGKDTGKAYLFSKMSQGAARPDEDVDSPTEPTEFDLYAEARLFNNRTKAGAGDDDDIREDVSEAGTYTIEDHSDACRHFDDALDVDDLDDVEAGGTLGLERPEVDSGHSTPQGGRSQTPTTDTRPLHAGGWRRYPDNGNTLLASTEAHAGSVRTSSVVTRTEEEEEESETTVPRWAGRPARILPGTVHFTSVGSRSQTPDSVEQTSKSGDKRVSSPQLGRGGKIGGRVLPTPPLCASPRTIQSPLVELKTIPTEVKDSTRDCATLSYAAGEGEKFTITYDAPKWSSRSEKSAGVMADTAGRLTGRSLASIDTAVLLQPTEVVLKELERRSAGKQNGRTAKIGGGPSRSSARVDDSDSEDDSAQALILGGRAIVKTAPKPADRKSPSVGSAALTKSKLVAKGAPTRSSTFIKQSSKSGKGPTPTPGFAAEIDSDCDDSIGFVEVPSTGMSLPSQTKVNRAFALRRDNSERLVEGRDSFNDGSGHSTSRSATASPRLDTHRTDASLGHEIVKRSRANARKAELSLRQSGCESDDGEHTQSSYGGSSAVQRQVRSAESKSASVSRTSSGAANKRTGGVGGTLVVSGQRPQTAKRSQTSPSPEYEAWRRRKEYNPQKSAAQGRTKGQGLKSGVRGQGQRPLSSSRSSVSSEGSGAGDDIDSYIRQHHHQPSHQSSNMTKGFSAFTHDLDMLTKASYDSSLPGTKDTFLLHRFLNVDEAVMQSERCVSPVSPAPTFLLHRDMPLSPSHSPLLRHVHTAQELMSMSEAPNSAMLSMIEQLSLSVSNQAIDIMARLMERDSSISSGDVKGLYEGQSEATILVDIYNNLRTTEHCLHAFDRALLVKSPSPSASSPRHSDLHRSSTFPQDSLDTARGSPWTAARERLEGADDYY